MSSDISAPPASKFDEVCALVRQLAYRVRQIEAGEEVSFNEPSPSRVYSDARLANVAASILFARHQRPKQFGVSLFGEPAWDMLLDLFLQHVNGKRVSSTSLCIGANVPQTTGLRYIELLQAGNLVRRYTPDYDLRLSLVDLTTQGLRLMRNHLTGTASRLSFPRAADWRESGVDLPVVALDGHTRI